MNKKVYAKPALEVVETEVAEIVCTSPTPGGYNVNNFDSGDTGIGYGGGGNGRAQGNDRGSVIWDD